MQRQVTTDVLPCGHTPLRTCLFLVATQTCILLLRGLVGAACPCSLPAPLVQEARTAGRFGPEGYLLSTYFLLPIDLRD